MYALFVLILLPAVVGLFCLLLFRDAKHASVAATVGTPLVTYILVKIADPGDPWNAVAVLLVSPLVIAVALIAIFVCAGRLRTHKRQHWNGA